MLLLGETDKTSFTDMGASGGITFQYYVETVNNTLHLESVKSKPAEFKAQIEKMSRLKAVNGKNDTVQLNWKALSGAKYYRIYYKASKDAKYEKIAEVSAKQTVYEHKNPVKGTAGYYKVTALQMNSGGILVESKSASAIVQVK